MVDYGIIHQSYYPHTPQQNSIGEYKHHHIIEITLTLLIQANVPLKF